jgi:hypothetical protein
MSSDGYYTEEVYGPHEYLDLGSHRRHLRRDPGQLRRLWGTG